MGRMSLPTTIASRVSALGLAALAAVVVPFSLLWDYSWEFTIGVETAWAPPHLATYGAVLLATLAALAGLISSTKTGQRGVRLGRLWAPFGSWLVLWGGAAFAVAVVLDRWWQVGYGQAAGIWHPPQLLKAVASMAARWSVASGVAEKRQRPASAAATRTTGYVPHAISYSSALCWRFAKHAGRVTTKIIASSAPPAIENAQAPEAPRL